VFSLSERTSDYGVDGFLRPGGPYDELLDYLYARYAEHYELGSDIDAVLTRDWKTKLAAALVPLGLENDLLFVEAATAHLYDLCTAKVQAEINRASVATGLPLSHPGLAETYQQIEHVSQKVKDGIKQIFDHAYNLREENLRISSELVNQPLPVDTFVEDFAVEAQNFATSLTQSVAFATGAIALRLVHSGTSNITSTILGFFSIFIAFGTMANVARYRNRNEKARVEFYDKNLLKVMKGFYTLMSDDQRDAISAEANPFASDLKEKAEHFISLAQYYGKTDQDLKSFLDSYQKVSADRSSVNDEALIVSFMRKLLEEFIPITFHDNSYLQVSWWTPSDHSTSVKSVCTTVTFVDLDGFLVIYGYSNLRPSSSSSSGGSRRPVQGYARDAGPAEALPYHRGHERSFQRLAILQTHNQGFLAEGRDKVRVPKAAQVAPVVDLHHLPYSLPPVHSEEVRF